MLKSKENILINGVDLAEELTDESDYLNDYFIVNSVSGRGIIGEENEIISAAKLDGAYASYSRTPVRYLDVTITAKGKDEISLHKKIERLNDLMPRGKDLVITFADEVDREYYGRLSDVQGEFLSNIIYRAVLTFICPDPFKYGEEKIIEFSEDSAIIENKGTATAKPIIELTAKEKSTFAMVTLGDEQYNLLGEPADTTEVVVDEKVNILKEDGSTLSGWSDSPVILDDEFSVANGELSGDASGIYASDYGSSSDKNHGGYKIIELPESINDFRLETHFDTDTPTDGETFRIEVYMIAEDLTILGKLGMLDGNVNLKRRVGLARVGEYKGYGVNYTHYSDNYKHDRVGSSQTWYLRFIREGKQVRTRIARRLRGEQVRGKNGVFNIIDTDMLKRLRYIGIYIGNYGDTKRPRLARINNIDVYKLNKVQQDQTPYVIYPDDIITFDHVNRDILLNGEARNDLKNFGGTFFEMEKGLNTITISPGDTFDTRISFRERWR